ncbi:MAG: glycosyl hydrolase [Candidatus Wallbacteria bacterium]|nr:glycosyl hydrolase [Candidatus Wallbacteria bacterium]
MQKIIVSILFLFIFSRAIHSQDTNLSAESDPTRQWLYPEQGFSLNLDSTHLINFIDVTWNDAGGAAKGTLFLDGRSYGTRDIGNSNIERWPINAQASRLEIRVSFDVAQVLNVYVDYNLNFPNPVFQPKLAFEPSNGMLFGAYTNDNEWQDLLNCSGKIPALRETYIDFPATPFDNRQDHPEQSISKIGFGNPASTPVIAWLPQQYLQQITSGSLDNYIREQARVSRMFSRPIFLRFGPKCNDPSVAWTGNPELYKAAFQHVYYIFMQEGAANVAFIFSAVYDRNGQNSWQAYYPGDQFVDWAGLDVYNRPDNPLLLDQMLDAFYNEYSGRKPIMLTEMACSEISSQPDNKAWWINTAFYNLKTKYPRVRAFIWFNAVGDQNWKVSSSPVAQKVFHDVMADPFFLSQVTGATPPAPPNPYNPYNPSPYNPNPYNPNPYAPNPYNPNPYNPNPYNPNPYNPNPYNPYPNPYPYNPNPSPNPYNPNPVPNPNTSETPLTPYTPPSPYSPSVPIQPNDPGQPTPTPSPTPGPVNPNPNPNPLPPNPNHPVTPH